MFYLQFQNKTTLGGLSPARRLSREGLQFAIAFSMPRYLQTYARSKVWNCLSAAFGLGINALL